MATEITPETKARVDEQVEKLISALRVINALSMGSIAWQRNQDVIDYANAQMKEKGIDRFL